MAKNFDASAPCSSLALRSQAPDLSTAKISLTNNGAVQQSASLDHMIWSVEAIIAALGASVNLQAGDLIFTGTPEGVGPVLPGDTLVGMVDGLPPIEVSFSDA